MRSAVGIHFPTSGLNESRPSWHHPQDNNNGDDVHERIEDGPRMILSSATLDAYAGACQRASDRLRGERGRISAFNVTATAGASALRSVGELERELDGMHALLESSVSGRNQSIQTTLQHMSAFLPPFAAPVETATTSKKYRKTTKGVKKEAAPKDSILLSTTYARSLRLTEEFQAHQEEEDEAGGRDKKPIVDYEAVGNLQTLLAGEATVDSTCVGHHRANHQRGGEDRIRHALLSAFDRLIEAKSKQVAAAFDFEQRCGAPFEMPVLVSAHKTGNQDMSRNAVITSNARGNDRIGESMHSTADLNVRLSKAALELATLRRRRARVDEDNARASGQLTRYLQLHHGYQVIQ